MLASDIIKTEILVIGGGAAGIAVARAAGQSALLVDNRKRLGGVLPQCIHHGFGMGKYQKDLTGPEYLERELDGFRKSGAAYIASATVLELKPDRTALVSCPDGLKIVKFRHCVLATGCREKSVFSLSNPCITGTRPEAVFTAGEAQEMINLGNSDIDYGIGKRIVILGSGDIGQIIARRLTLIGKEVVGMIEMRSELGGLKRNRDECIAAFNIPVLLNSTVSEIHGYPRITGVTVVNLNDGSKQIISCDTLISSLGLIPDKQLADKLPVNGQYPEWLHFCGNSDYVHEIVDSVSSDGEKLACELLQL